MVSKPLPFEVPPGGRYRVTLSFSRDPYLGQIYAGFQLLERKGLVALDWSRADQTSCSHVLEVDVDGRHIVYDMLDGFNWVRGDHAQNLRHFREHAGSGSYFKRSFDPVLRKWAPEGCRVEPFGLNYPIQPLYDPSPWPWTLRERLIHDHRVRRLLGRQPVQLPFREYETDGEAQGQPRVLFATRLWDPDSPEVETEEEVERRRRMNVLRIEAVDACQRAFGSAFTGGIQDSPYARRSVPARLMLSAPLSKRQTFLAKVATHEVCVTTSGLHGSTGWRFGEFVAAGRAIVAEPPGFEAPGLHEGQHYLQFSTVDELVQRVERLLNDHDMRATMINNTRAYYNDFTRPDTLVWRTLQLAMPRA